MISAFSNVKTSLNERFSLALQWDETPAGSEQMCQSFSEKGISTSAFKLNNLVNVVVVKCFLSFVLAASYPQLHNTSKQSLACSFNFVPNLCRMLLAPHHRI